MTDLLNEMETALTDLMQSGLATWGPGQRLRKLSEDCEAMGLHTGTGLMERIAALLDDRTHAIEKDDLPLTAAVCRAVRYITLCREKSQADGIMERWSRIEKQEISDRHDRSAGGGNL